MIFSSYTNLSDTNRLACIVSPAAVHVTTSLAASCTRLRRLIPARRLPAYASNQSLCELDRCHLFTTTVLPNFPMPRAEDIVITVQYAWYPWDTVTLLRYAKALN